MTSVQYGAGVALVYDRMFADPTPTEMTVQSLTPYVRGRDVLELGVGTGRIAVPLAGEARSITGVDNSPDMLRTFREKGVPANVTLVEADFRDPVPGRPGQRFDAAYSTLGSMACCLTRDDLRTALGHVRNVLHPGAVFCMEYYARELYLEVIRLTGGTMSTSLPGGEQMHTRLAVDPDTDIMTATTDVRAGNETTSFAEQVLLLDSAEITKLLRVAGFGAVHVAGGPEQPFIWYIAETPAQHPERTESTP
ncbi:class I SAM-dependent DNA methyltransferase [Micromonospora sp. NPDC050784]|uniref:class I SAM-dependent DNA methyltransferase n=1 Tax=Micromonospora sp. NPDC050784 TaxID=3364281 RepID=UPI00379D58A7